MPFTRTQILSWLGHLPFLAIAVSPFAASAEVTPSNGPSLEWNVNPEPDVVGYKVYLGTESKNYTSVADVSGTTKMRLPSVSLGTTFYLAVSAYNAKGEESPKSAELKVIADVPTATSDTSMSFSAPGQGQLQWRYPTSNVPAADKFTIYASEDLKTWKSAGTVDASASSSSDANWLYYKFPYSADKRSMFFKVEGSNAFGEVR